MGNKLKDLTGIKFGRLIILSRGKNKSGRTTWNCLCDCGEEKNIVGSDISRKNNSIKSCGCVRRERIVSMNKEIKQFKTHGMSKTAVYGRWCDMKKRCYNKNVSNYHNYGGRGIGVCKRWFESFDNFYNDMGDPPVGHSIERKDNNGNYEPDNCRWANRIDQNRNTRSNVIITCDSVSLCVSEWADKLGFDNAGLIYGRISRGWSDHDIVTIPKGESRRNDGS